MNEVKVENEIFLAISNAFSELSNLFNEMAFSFDVDDDIEDENK